MTERGKNVLLTVVSICLTLVICEVGLRAWQGVPPFSATDFRDRDPLKVKKTVKYDSALGWTLRDDLDRPDLHTLAYGIRRNSAAQQGPRPGNILAVGASLTQGLGVADAQSWPAQLEGLLGQPVDNAGVVGYALDQTVLRAEQLLPEERPRVLLFGVDALTILWTQSTIVWGGPKPFFTVEAGVLHAHNSPMPETGWERGPLDSVKNVLGHSALIDIAMSLIDPDDWLPSTSRDAGGTSDPANVSCRLLRRLKQELDARKVRAILVAEARRQDVVATKSAAPELVLVQECARQAGYRIVDTLAALRAEHQSDPQRTANYWPKGQQHLSELGNHRVAELVAGVLATESRQSEAR